MIIIDPSRVFIVFCAHFYMIITDTYIFIIIIIMLYLQPKVGLHDYMFMSHTESYYYYTRKTVKYTKVV